MILVYQTRKNISTFYVLKTKHTSHPNYLSRHDDPLLGVFCITKTLHVEENTYKNTSSDNSLRKQLHPRSKKFFLLTLVGFLNFQRF